MKNVIKLLAILCVIVFSADKLSAQSEIEISDIIDIYDTIDQARYKLRVKQVVTALYEHFTLMTLPKKKISVEEREKAKDRALGLFVANGNLVKTPSGKVRSAMVQTTSTKSSKKWETPIIRYCNNLMKYIINGKYTDIIIKIDGEIDVCDIKEMYDGSYQCIASFPQLFYGVNKEFQYEYGDITMKHIEVWILPSGEIRLFDINADVTKKYSGIH